jgi:chemotaxis protein CheX
MAIKYDVAFINPFLEAVINVLSTMAMVSATPGRRTSTPGARPSAT